MGIQRDEKGTLLPVVENELLKIFPVMLTAQQKPELKEDAFGEPPLKKAKTEGTTPNGAVQEEEKANKPWSSPNT